MVLLKLYSITENQFDFKSLVLLDTAEAILLGFQHYLVMIGTSVIIASIVVPLMGGGNVKTPCDYRF